MLDTADGQNWDYEKKSDELHFLFPDELAQGPTFTTAHLLGRRLRARGEKVSADNKEEKHLSKMLGI